MAIITFEQLSHAYKDTLFNWLSEPHMQEFWDNSQEHKDDIINFINGRVTPSLYFDGVFTYWIGLIENEPFCFILTAQENSNRPCPQLYTDYMSTTGSSYSLDFGIGNTAFLNKGLAAPSLEAFTIFFKTQIDPSADTFFIDPDADNPRAQHVYEKAGFKLVGEFIAEKVYWDFTGEKSYLMVKKMVN